MSGKRLLILSDSVALPRSSPEQVIYEETWPAMLKSTYLVHQVSIGGATILDLYKQVNYHKNFDPEYVVLQVGIVDCSPRFMTRFELDLFKRIPLIGKRIISAANKPGIRSIRKKTYVPIEVFRQYAGKIKRSFNGAKIFALGILEATDMYDQMLPGVSANIRKYNGVLKDVFNEMYISLEDFPDAGIMSDFHHINREGHEHIYEKMKTRLQHND